MCSRLLRTLRFVQRPSARPIRAAVSLLFVTILQFTLYLVQRVTHWSVVRLVDIKVLMRINGQRELDLEVVLPLLLFSAVMFVTAHVAFARRVP